jgi:polyisoprenoid-binding protein YceI
MKKRLILLLIIVIPSLTIFAQTLKLNEGNIRFISDKKGFSAENTSFTSEINIQEKTISFIVPIVKFSFVKPKMEKHFNNKGVMNSKEFPTATFNGKIITDKDLTKPGTYQVTVEGKINIHNVEKDYKAEGSIKITSEGVAIKSEFVINREDFEIKGLYASMTDDVIKVYLVSVYK